MIKKAVEGSATSKVEAALRSEIVRLYKAKAQDKKPLVDAIASGLNGNIAVLVEELKDTNPFKAADIGAVLDAMGPRIVPQLAELLNNDNQFIQGAAIGALTKAGKTAAEPMVRLLKSASQKEVGAAAAVLRYQGSNAVDALSKACNPKSPDYSSMAVALLAEIDPAALATFRGYLAEGLGSEDQYISGAAIKAYKAIGPAAAADLVGLMESANPYLQQNSINVLKEIGAGAIAELVDALGADNQFLQQNAYQVLKAIGAPAVPALIDSSAGNNQARVANARRLLGEIGRGTDTKRKWWPFGR
ncbi:MAG: HEAT repeat domain-containing protein [Rhizobiaceae bacterium]